MIQKATFRGKFPPFMGFLGNWIQSGLQLHTIFIRMQNTLVGEGVETRENTQFRRWDGL